MRYYYCCYKSLKHDIEIYYNSFNDKYDFLHGLKRNELIVFEDLPENILNDTLNRYRNLHNKIGYDARRDF